MFSGIIDCIGEVVDAGSVPGGMALHIRAPGYWTGVATGASIAIDGVCLTATTTSADTATFDVVAETLRRTTLGSLRPGGCVNLQKSLKAGDPIDGHFVQGHVDAVAKVQRVEQSPPSRCGGLPSMQVPCAMSFPRVRSPSTESR